MSAIEAKRPDHHATSPTADGTIVSRPARVPTCQTAARRSINLIKARRRGDRMKRREFIRHCSAAPTR
jgi:hypothetical protein